MLEACASVDERIIAERLVERAEANEIAKVTALADAIAAKGIETYAEFLIAVQGAQRG